MGRAKFAKNLQASPFNKGLSNEASSIQIYLDEQCLKWMKGKQSFCLLLCQKLGSNPTFLEEKKI
jgi:hypothetical protein